MKAGRWCSLSIWCLQPHSWLLPKATGQGFSSAQHILGIWLWEEGRGGRWDTLGCFPPPGTSGPLWAVGLPLSSVSWCSMTWHSPCCGQWVGGWSTTGALIPSVDICWSGGMTEIEPAPVLRLAALKETPLFLIQLSLSAWQIWSASPQWKLYFAQQLQLWISNQRKKRRGKVFMWSPQGVKIIALWKNPNSSFSNFQLESSGLTLKSPQWIFSTLDSKAYIFIKYKGKSNTKAKKHQSSGKFKYAIFMLWDCGRWDAASL